MAPQIIIKAPLLRYRHNSFYVDDKERARYIELSADSDTESLLMSYVGQTITISVEEKQPEPILDRRFVKVLQGG